MNKLKVDWLLREETFYS